MVRLLSQEIGYTAKQAVKIPSREDIVAALERLGLSHEAVFQDGVRATELGDLLLRYFEYRATAINEFVSKQLMDAKEARALFLRIRGRKNWTCPFPANKQKGKKRGPAYLTGLVNMLIADHIGGGDCDYNPLELTTITRGGAPLRTLARRVDGAYPSPINPVAIWEIKEYYYTTTFGSRVADGVYESLLDGLELEELFQSEGIEIRHYLIVDGRYTWWECGRSYLCRIVDLLNMGYVDEAIFGREVVDRIPELARQWREELGRRAAH